MIVDLRAETVDHLMNGDELRALQIQCACFVSSARLMLSARRALSKAMAAALALDCRSFCVAKEITLGFLSFVAFKKEPLPATGGAQGDRHSGGGTEPVGVETLRPKPSRNPTGRY